MTDEEVIGSLKEAGAIVFKMRQYGDYFSQNNMIFDNAIKHIESLREEINQLKNGKSIGSMSNKIVKLEVELETTKRLLKRMEPPPA